MNKQSQEEYRKAMQDLGDFANDVEQVIDMHFTQFAEIMEDKNIGMLKSIRFILESKLEEVDRMGAGLVNSKFVTFAKDERLKLGSVFTIVAKIIDRIGYIDFLIKKRKI